MFGLFKKKKTEKELLLEKYDKLLEESYKLSHTDRAASALKTEEAENLMNRIEKMD